ncbi:CotH kinase family protein [Melittangium boletus]|uniref:EF-hand domain-containing protein n=1 Tax=Melittangium boletus DSM 14713 TaxID=1294270 RepID=A0A250IL39_9BACT|nr:CotH kinase family protein [Melittangium boletus]ATB31911.1 hypothetical protein MEBOL_005383 [Melittangium boletus DSM 14713]
MKTVSGVLVGLFGVLGLAGGAVAAPAARPAPDSAAKLFQTNTVWDVHLSFTPEQWAAIEPAPPARGPAGGPGGPPRGMGPANLLVPGMMRDGDLDQSGTLSKEEMRALATRWFSEWDEGKRGKLDAEQLRGGLSAMSDMATLLAGGHKGRRGEEKRGGLAALMGIEFPYVHANLDFEGKGLSDVGVRYKGNFSYMQSRDQLKRSLKVDLDRFEPKRAWLGLSTLNFHSNVTDASWMNEVLSYRFYRDAGVPASRTTYARVSISVPGKYDHEYLGLYSIVEDVDASFARTNFGSEQGAIFKPSTPALFTDLGDDWADYERTYEPKGTLTPKQSARLIQFCKFVSHASDAEFAAKLDQFLDVEAFARYLAATVHLSTLDSLLVMGQNFHVYLHPKTQKFSIIPWDLDHSFGQFPMLNNKVQEDLNIDKPWQGDKRFLARVFQVEKFKKLYVARLKELNQGLFKPERFSQQVDETAKVLRPFIEAESADKLARFDKVVAGELIEPLPIKMAKPPPSAPGAAPGGPPAPMLDKVRPIKVFAGVRARSVADQLAGKSKGTSLDRPGPGGANPTQFLAPVFQATLDSDKDGDISQDEFIQGFGKWFDGWSPTGDALSREQLMEGVNKVFMPAPPPKPAP